MTRINDPLRVIVYEGEGAEGALEPDERVAVMQTLLEDGCPVHYSGTDGEIEVDANGCYLVLGRFPNHDGPLWRENDDVQFVFRSVEECSPDSIQSMLAQVRQELGLKSRENWKPWFPTIDMDRCTNCLQCLSFCLFDVYSVNEEGTIQVQNPTNCKTDCPACSRVCPEVAIIFPKYRSGPINGDQVNEEDLNREKMKVDISALLGGDIYQKLRKRTEHARTRFSKERGEDRALQERQRCLAKLKEQFDIPDEVLASLPSEGDIQEKLKQLQAQHDKTPSDT